VTPPDRDQQVGEKWTFEESVAHAEAIADDFGSVHAALIEVCFAPPESYDDAWLEKIWEVFQYVESRPCTCTEPAVDLERPCPRCRVLNRKFDEYDGAGR
jgi:hypothetical protein